MRHLFESTLTEALPITVLHRGSDI